jgi:hypothetical protein
MRLEQLETPEGRAYDYGDRFNSTCDLRPRSGRTVQTAVVDTREWHSIRLKSRKPPEGLWLDQEFDGILRGSDRPNVFADGLVLVGPP